jgi:hypothetical protein
MLVADAKKIGDCLALITGRTETANLRGFGRLSFNQFGHSRRLECRVRVLSFRHGIASRGNVKMGPVSQLVNGGSPTRSPLPTYLVSSNNSRPISMRRISLVPAPIS